MKNPPVILIVAAALFAIVILGAFLLPNVVGATAPGVQAQRSSVSTQEADAWAEARAADTPAAYRVYLAAYPQGAFAQNAQQELTPAEPVQAAQAAPAAPRRIAQTSTPVRRGPSAAEIASSCQAFVDTNWPAPSRLVRIGGGAVGGCAVGAMAGGDDQRNCTIGAVAGGVAGGVSARTRDARRTREYNACVANGGPA